jgi:hypothetical protein
MRNCATKRARQPSNSTAPRRPPLSARTIHRLLDAGDVPSILLADSAQLVTDEARGELVTAAPIIFSDFIERWKAAVRMDTALFGTE